jgi:Asp-tRNA(Asn)/Glu-tRNA(Gln) amidotransferase A subunit family amidase
VVGFKPSVGLVPAAGILPFSPTLDQPGTFTSNVSDAALLASCIAEGGAIAPEIAAPASPPRVAVIREYPWTRADADAAAHFDAVLKRLERAGARIIELELPELLRDANRVHRTIMFYEAAREHEARQREHRAQFSAALNAGLDEGRQITDDAYRDALARRAAIAEFAQDMCEDCDVIASLPAPGIAPARLDVTGDPSYCTLWSLTGQPAITLPSGFSSAGLLGNAVAGLPYGLQLAAATGADDRLLSCALWCERVLAK